MLKLMGKKKFTLLRSKSLLIQTYAHALTAGVIQKLIQYLSFQIGASFSKTNVSTFVVDVKVSLYIPHLMNAVAQW